MNKIILKNSVKEIKKSYRRFLSLLLISMLGVGFFAGVKATTPDMQKTIDAYFDKEKLFDVKVVSTLGLTDEDVEKVKEIDGISEVYGTYSKDVFVNIDDVDIVVKVIELTNNINNVKLIEGRLPQGKNECVVEHQMVERENVKIGDTITIKEELGEDEESSFYERDLVVVGTVDSPLFISNDKGTSNLGSGKLAYYLYSPKENINSDFYTEIYVVAEGAKELNTTSKEYSDYIDDIIDRVDKIKEERQDARYNSLLGEATDKLDDAEKELNEKKAEGEKEIADAEKKIKDGEKELADGQKKLADGKEEAHTEIENATSKLTVATQEFEGALKTFNFRKEQAENSFREAESKKAELQNNYNQVMAGLNEVNSQYNQVVAGLANPLLPAEQKAVLEGTKAVLEGKKQELNETASQIQAGITQIDMSVESGRLELTNGENAIAQAQAEISNGWNELNSKKAEAEAEFAKAEKEIADANKKLSEGKQELEDAKREFNEKIADAENKLLDARQKLADIEEAKWYIWDRSSNSGYDSYVSDAQNIEKLGNVFPILFFVIAILISLTSMTRMVEEQRIELGTMKALRVFKYQYLCKIRYICTSCYCYR